MLDIMALSPSLGALHQRPLTAAEIDVHPDRDRIWATIVAVREAADALVDDAEARADAAEEEGRDDAQFAICRRIDALLRGMAKLSDADRAAIMEAVE